METKTITISLDKAREWFNSGNYECKQLALQVFSEEELATPITDWQEIKSFESACKTLGLDTSLPILSLETEFDFGKHLTALYKLDIIKQALNRDYKPSLVHGTVYYPWVRFYKSYDDAKSAVRNNDWELCGKVEIEGTSYYLVGGGCRGCDPGLGYFRCGYGGVNASLGLLCCKSREIAQHMSKYFAKEIFDAMYIQHDNYKWI